MKNIIYFFTFISLIISSNALAHGPVRQLSGVSIEINTNANDLWTFITNYADPSWHPLIEKVLSSDGNKKGAKRTFSLTTGGQVTQVLKLADSKKMKFKYRTPTDDMTILSTVEFQGIENPVRSFPVDNLIETILVESMGSNKSKLIWNAVYYRGYKNNLRAGELPELNEDAANSAMQNFIIKGILAVANQFDKNLSEEYIETCFPPKKCN